MKITREYYRDFMGTLKQTILEIQSEIDEADKACERGEYDFCEMYEYNDLKKTVSTYGQILDYFKQEERCAEFDSLDALNAYADTIDSAYKAMQAYSNAVLPVEGGDTIGVTSREWEWIETSRCYCKSNMFAWSSFVEFCEFGMIL